MVTSHPVFRVVIARFSQGKVHDNYLNISLSMNTKL